MSSIPPQAGMPPGRVPLDGPPPLPAQMSTDPTQQGYSSVGAESAEDPAKAQLKGLADAFQTVDQVLMSAAQALPTGAKEFAAARKLIEQGLSKGLASIGQSPETSPTAAGSQFPGGGFGSIGGLGR